MRHIALPAVPPSLDPRALLTDHREPDDARLWLFEWFFVWVRWIAIGLLVALFWLFPRSTWPVIGLLSFGVGLGNGFIAWKLRCGPACSDLRIVQRFATVLEWLGAVIAIAARSQHVAATTPHLLFIVTLTTAVRYRHRGLALATSAGLLTVGVLTAAQWRMHELLSGEAAARLLIDRGAMIVLEAVAVYALLCLSTERRTIDRLRHADAYSALRQLRSGLISRETRILELLPQRDLRYADIAKELGISEETRAAYRTEAWCLRWPQADRRQSTGA